MSNFKERCLTWYVYSKEHYDRGVNTFSPEGRIYQIEYAIEAIKVSISHHCWMKQVDDSTKISFWSCLKTWLKFGSTAIGVKTNEGVVLGVEKKLPSKLMEPSKSEKLVEVRILALLSVINHISCIKGNSYLLAVYRLIDIVAAQWVELLEMLASWLIMLVLKPKIIVSTTLSPWPLNRLPRQLVTLPSTLEKAMRDKSASLWLDLTVSLF